MIQNNTRARKKRILTGRIVMTESNNTNVNSQQIRTNRIFVLDTNVLLHDSNSIFTFKGVVVGIPFIVLEELDSFKKERDDKGMHARKVIRSLDNLRKNGKLHEGVNIGDGTSSILKVLLTPTIDSPHLCSDSNDDRIIQTVKNLVDEGNNVTFVTKDINARVKADALGLEAEDYTKETITQEKYYKGWVTLALSATEIKNLSPKTIGSFLEGHTLYPNEFIVANSQNNSENNRLFRFLGGSTFQEVNPFRFPGNFEAKNIQQLMAVDLLMDPSIKIISLLGQAGTGKTFLTLLAGLYLVVKTHAYKKFLISRPVIALGADVGYLPGDLQEKLFHWMQPIYDNLEFIFNEMHGNVLVENSKDRRQKKRHDHKSVDSEIERLKHKGLLSLEAITYMRGRSIPYQFVFIDEAQNLTPHEIKTIVTRVGEGTKIIIAGDPYQIDSPYLDFTSNGLTVTSDKFKGQSIFGTVFLETSERSDVATLAAELL